MSNDLTVSVLVHPDASHVHVQRLSNDAVCVEVADDHGTRVSMLGPVDDIRAVVRQMNDMLNEMDDMERLESEIIDAAVRWANEERTVVVFAGRHPDNEDFLRQIARREYARLYLMAKVRELGRDDRTDLTDIDQLRARIEELELQLEARDADWVLAKERAR